MDLGFFSWGDENVPELDSGDGGKLCKYTGNHGVLHLFLKGRFNGTGVTSIFGKKILCAAAAAQADSAQADSAKQNTTECSHRS